MAVYDITQVNGVTKVETEKGYLYHFPLEIIETFTQANAMKRTQRGQTDSEYVKFTSISNSLGTGNITSYVDALAVGGFYLTLDNTSSTLLGTGTLTTNAEIDNTSLLNSINDSMKEMVFLLKAIAE